MSGVGANPFSLETTLSASQMQALTQYLERLMRCQNDELHERLNQMANRANHEDNRRRRRDNDGEPRQNRVEGVKLKILPFKGKGDPKAYLEWELKIEHLCSCYNYIEEQKVWMATTEFSDYALIWCNKYQKERQRNEKPIIYTWGEMRSITKEKIFLEKKTPFEFLSC